MWSSVLLSRFSSKSKTSLTFASLFFKHLRVDMRLPTVILPDFNCYKTSPRHPLPFVSSKKGCLSQQEGLSLGIKVES